MKQDEAIRQVGLAVKGDPAVRAVFLKGAHARGEQDAYSDVDLYCLVHSEGLTDFLARRISHMESYKPLILWSEANFVGPQIVGVFEDGLHFDLYTVTEESLKQTEQILVLYDPEGYLANYKAAESFPMSDAEITRILSGFTFSLLEFETAYLRGDLLWAHRLGSHLAADLMAVLRHVVDPSTAQLGIKRLHHKLSPQQLDELTGALNGLGPDALPSGVKKLVDLAAALIADLTERLSENWNQRFFDFMVKRIYALS
ncbi:nucleotidyltransferase domain-containing protein [Paenibacillus sp. FSL L8-0470]|uniref:nucleotidyltransferase domain-containing protein n=1 Tax=Paenibacillus sp. FSL L8-0470 TaxID=2954688 RepID=UPI0030F68DC4